MSNGNSLKLNFPRQILIAVIVIAGLSVFPLEEFGDDEIVKSFIAGLVITVVNVLMGYAAIEFSFDTTYTKFMQIVLGGVGVRLFLMSLALLVLIGMYKFHVVSLIATLFGLYIVFLTLEIFYIHNKWQHKLSQNTENS